MVRTLISEPEGDAIQPRTPTSSVPMAFINDIALYSFAEVPKSIAFSFPLFIIPRPMARMNQHRFQSLPESQLLATPLTSLEAKALISCRD